MRRPPGVFITFQHSAECENVYWNDFDKIDCSKTMKSERVWIWYSRNFLIFSERESSRATIFLCSASGGSGILNFLTKFMFALGILDPVVVAIILSTVSLCRNQTASHSRVRNLVSGRSGRNSVVQCPSKSGTKNLLRYGLNLPYKIWSAVKWDVVLLTARFSLLPINFPVPLSISSMPT